MPPTQDQRTRFGQRLQELRIAAGLRSREALAERLAAEGVSKTGATVEGWEKGRWAPSNRSEVDALERILNADGELLPLLGYTGGATANDRLDRLEAEIAEIRELVRRIVADPPPARSGRGAGGAKP